MRALLLLGLLFSFFSCQPPAKNPPLKNVLFILVDDLGAMDLSSYGSRFHRTPHLDRLAEESLMFTQAYAASPVCSPTRAALLTGRYPTRLNITDWIPGQNPKGTAYQGPEDGDYLALEELTLAELLKAQGYSTFFAGKWHLGDEGHFPEDQGFDINLGGHHRGSPPAGYYSPYHNPKLSDGPEGEYLPDRLTQEAISFLEQTGEKPFLLYLSYYTVHTPIQASKRHIDEWEAALDTLPLREPSVRPEGKGESRLQQSRADYASMIAALDENLGKLLQALKAQGLDKNTLVIFTSDNGGLSTLAPQRNAPTSNEPLRAGKGWCYEGGIRVPLIIRPGTLETQAKVIDEPVISMDLLPTIMNALDFELPSARKIDGVDILRAASAERSLFWHFPHYHGSMWEPGSAMRQGKWKYIRFLTEEREELFDLSTDPEEKNNLSAAHPEQLQQMRRSMDTWYQETQVQLPTLRSTVNHE
ncbi:MAG: sulfatase [Bacteroidota bacterium]